jgi:hypothetical protein
MRPDRDTTVMFKRSKPAYTVEEIAQQVTNLERLNKLLDMCIQKQAVLNGEQQTRFRLPQKIEGYNRNIDTAQKLLDHMAEVNSK